jgi:hypothetical protein
VSVVVLLGLELGDGVSEPDGGTVSELELVSGSESESVADDAELEELEELELEEDAEGVG